MTKAQWPPLKVIAHIFPVKPKEWFWLVELARDNGLIGPFETKAEAILDAKETLRITEGET